MVKGLIKICLIAFVLFSGISCQKEAMNGVNLAGVYEVYKYEYQYFSDNGNQLDSTFQDEDLGTINLLFEHSTLGINYLSFNLKGGRLVGWSKIPPSVSGITWSTVKATDEIIQFSNAPDGDKSLGEITLISYTIDYQAFDKLKWVWVNTDANGAMIGQEIVYLKRL